MDLTNTKKYSSINRLKIPVIISKVGKQMLQAVVPGGLSLHSVCYFVVLSAFSKYPCQFLQCCIIKLKWHYTIMVLLYYSDKIPATRQQKVIKFSEYF